MGSNHLRVDRLAARCCQGACFAIGFLLTALFLSVMLWIVWCYLGLSIVQVSDTQRRAVVNYSYTTPPQPNRTTKAPPAVESSANSISRSASTTTTAARVHGRGETSPLVVNKEKDRVAELAKGDFADRSRANVTGRAPDGARIANSQGVPTVPSHAEEETKTASILTGAKEDDETVLPRRVSTSAVANQHTRDVAKKDTDDRRKQSPSQLSPAQPQDDGKNRPRKDDSIKDEDKPSPRDYPDSGRSVPRGEDDLQSSRRRPDPDFDRDYPRPPSSRDRGRYDEDDLSDARGRYDKRDRGRDTEDRLSKGDTRVYPDDVDRKRPVDDRYPDRRPAGDGDRYLERRPIEDDDRYAPRDRYDQRRRGDDGRTRDRDHPRDRVDGSDLDRNRDRTYENKRPMDRDDDYRYRPRDDGGRYRDGDRRYAERDDEYRYYRPRDDERRYDERRYDDRPRDQDYRSPTSGSRDPDKDRIPSRHNSTGRDDDHVPNRRDPVDDRRPYDDRISPTRVRDEFRSSSYDSRDDDRARERVPSRSYDDDRRYPDDRGRDDGYYRYDDRKKESSRLISPSSVVESANSRRDFDDREYRPKPSDDREYRTMLPEDRENRPKSSDDREYRTRLSDDREYRPKPSDDREYRTRLPDDREFRPKSSDDREYRTRLPEDREYRPRYSDDREYPPRSPDDRKPEERKVDRKDDVILDHRSYGSDEDGFRRDDPNKDEVRRIRPGDEEYVRKSDDEYRVRSRGDYDADRPRRREEYGDPPRSDRPVEERRRYSDDIAPKREAPRYSPTDSRDRRYRPEDDDYRPPRSSSHRDVYDDRPPRSSQRDYIDDRPMRSSSQRDYIDDRPSIRDGIDDRPSRSYQKDYIDDRPLKSSQREGIDDRPSRSSHRDYIDDRPPMSSSKIDDRPPPSSSKTDDRPSQRDGIDNRPSRSSQRDGIDDRPPRTTRRDPLTISAPETSRSSGSEGGSRENKYQEERETRPLSPQDVIEAAQRHQDAQGSNARKVFYPAFDPKVSNLTSPELIRDSERRGITLASRRRRRTLNP